MVSRGHVSGPWLLGEKEQPGFFQQEWDTANNYKMRGSPKSGGGGPWGSVQM